MYDEIDDALIDELEDDTEREFERASAVGEAPEFDEVERWYLDRRSPPTHEEQRR